MMTNNVICITENSKKVEIMLDYVFKIVLNNREIPFDEAIKRKYINITSNGFHINNNVKVYEWTGLMDENNNRIFANDILQSQTGEQYKIEEKCGTYFIKEVIGTKGCLPIALSGLKLNNKIDNMRII